MSRLSFSICLLTIATFLSAQTYVWKDGLPMLTDPDSITFVKPEMGAKVWNIKEATNSQSIYYRYLTKDYQGKPIWLSAMLFLDKKQMTSKHIQTMAMYNHYTIMRADEAPTCDNWDLQMAAQAFGMAIVSPDYEGFGESCDRLQAYCFAEANARACIDATLAAREWLLAQGYTLADSIVNFGYSQGGQTTVAALKLSQTEYKDRIRFIHSIAGAGPFDLTLTYRKFLEWKTIGQMAAMPLMLVTINELLGLKLNYNDLFQKPLSTNWKMWILSKKYNTDEASQLLAADSIQKFMAPAYCDSTTAEARTIIHYTDSLDFFRGWIPDPDTRLSLYHSKKDDVVPFENSRNLYHFLQQHGCNNVTIDSTSLTSTHLSSGTLFFLLLSNEFAKLKNGN